MKERILLKLSGGSLRHGNEIFNEQKLLDLASQIKELSKSYEIGIVIGGGNIWRGKDGKLSFLSPFERDYIGMVSTVVNSFVLTKALAKVGINSSLFTSLEIERLSMKYNLSQIEESFSLGKVIVFGGGLGEPQFSTDSAAIIRAIEIKAKKILIGKEGVEGVYNKDPKECKDAIFYNHVSYDRLLAENIKILDQASLILAKDNKLHLFIFNQDVDNCFVKALKKEIKLSEVY